MRIDAHMYLRAPRFGYPSSDGQRVHRLRGEAGPRARPMRRLLPPAAEKGEDRGPYLARGLREARERRQFVRELGIRW